MKIDKLIYWITTGLVSTLMLASASMYFINTEEVKEIFVRLNYPAYLVIPLAVAKILAVIAIVSRWSKTLKEWAYVGLLIDFSLAFFAHYEAQDGGHTLAAFAIMTLLISYLFEKRL
ncbi:MAG: DoxX family protein [Reichenbachiella sp.]|uniref:DoxX family protein n=1 Tax=Reichenbachiella sp. TaxID=2184521 RepID=UPI0032979A35